MSLVAYGASDNSESDSDNEEQQGQNQITTTHRSFESATTTTIPSLKASTSGIISSSKRTDHIGNISDEEDFETVSSTSATTFTTTTNGNGQESHFKLEKKRFPNIYSDSSDIEEKVNSTSLHTLDDLPAPQVRTPTNTDTVEEDLEEEVKPKASEIANAPKPPSKKPRQPVKISIPSLDETPEEDRTESKKNLTASNTKSGLFSLLPAPIHSAKKEINRPLIPHTLTKKAAVPPKKSATSGPSVSVTHPSRSEVASSSDGSTRRMTPFNALTGYDSDSDDDNADADSNFFSLTSSTQKVSKDRSEPPPSSRLQSEEVSSSRSDSNSVKRGSTSLLPAADSEEASSTDTKTSNDISEGSKKEEKPEAEEGTGEEEEEEEKVTPPQPEPGSFNDAPLDFGSTNRLRSWSSSSNSFLNPVGLSGSVTSAHPALPSYENPFTLPSNSLYNMANAQESEPMSGDVGDELDEVPSDDLKQFMSDKEFQRLQGKRKRGMEESINFVDAKVDDYVDPSEVSKHLTEETEYVSHKNKDNLPTSQQKRKKQITYLAYQAKERELELKNTWAANRMTKKQTQSKYGF